MIIKSFELKNKNLKKINFYLLYGNNKGFIDETINKSLKPILSKNVYNYDETEILKEPGKFEEDILNKSFFENEKLIIISRASDKIYQMIDDIVNKDISDIAIILKSNVLEKKSKIRNFFEKNSNTVCVPFYEDNHQTLSLIAQNFFKKKQINISQENINLLIERARGDRLNLNNELEKIEFFSKNKKKIEINEILKLTNLAENFSVSELVESSLVRNKKKTLTILNENNFDPDECILILRVYLSKLKRLLKIQEQIKSTNNIDNIISSYRPPIFWKEKEIVKQQIKTLNCEDIKKLIIKTNEIELQVKRRPLISLNILTNFILELTITTNN
jgi:DNA polymerase III subunit delta